MSAHAERAHAKLSASGSHRWLACPGSVRLESQFPDQSSEYAAEGTAAHELAELMLHYKLGELNQRQYDAQLKKHKAGEHYSQEMHEYMETYTDLVIERINTTRSETPDATVLLEHRLDFSPWVPDGFGTGDVVIISEGTVEIIDLKYGKGIPVSAWENSQMRLYALGAYHEFSFIYDVDTVKMTIVQPRLDNISEDTLTVEELLDWAEKVVKPKAQEALSDDGELVAGDHCRFCRARHTCRVRAEANLALARYDFQDPNLLSLEEIGEVLAKADELKAWVGDVEKYALEQAHKHGVKIPGWKLVEGRSNRRYKDEDQVAERLISEGYSEKDIFQKKLLGISKMEKVVGKLSFQELLGDLVIKPAGKPVLVPESDKRPELNSIESAQKDFS